jgi:hypothetical protein
VGAERRLSSSSAGTPEVTLPQGIHLPHPDMDVRISAAPTANHLFTTVSIDVAVDGVTVLRTGGQPRATGTTSVELVRAGRTHTLSLSWDRYTPQGFPCVVRLDGVELGHRVVPLTRGAGLRFMPVLLLGVVPVVMGILAYLLGE